MRGIDTHAHVFSATAPAVPGARYRPAYEASLGAWQAQWGRCGIARGVVVQVSFFGNDNSEVLAAIARDPHRLRGVAVVEPGIDDAGLAQLHAGGVRAIRLNLKSVTDYRAFATDAWASLLARIHALGWHAEVYADGGRLPEIVPAFSGTPVAVVFDHFGNPGATSGTADATFAAVDTLARSRPVWAKLSGAYRLGGADPVALASRWLDVVGPERLVWGSDWPWTGHEHGNDYGRLHAALVDWVGPQRAGAILWDNAARLYEFP